MVAVTSNTLGKFAKSNNKRKRDASVSTRAKYARKSVDVNRSLIKANADAIRAVKRMIPPPVYTDYQYSRGFSPFIATSPTLYTSIRCDKLMNPTQWLPCLRRDDNALESTTTLVKRMQLNLRYDLRQSSWVQITTFVVSLRKDAANRDPFDTTTLVENDDYIVSNGQNQNARLNPAVFKVHYARNVSLMSAAWRRPENVVGGDNTLVSTSETTFDKGQVNMSLNTRLRQPTTPLNWKSMTQEQLIAPDRLYLLSFFTGSTQNAEDDAPVVGYDALYTCYNSS
ncbi:MAG: hypothetical protein [Circular genetic element sp.]|nr:MAG: hypothetical protein [Circular genetic element sp.]